MHYLVSLLVAHDINLLKIKKKYSTQRGFHTALSAYSNIFLQLRPMISIPYCRTIYIIRLVVRTPNIVHSN
jgi:hypothetical protein